MPATQVSVGTLDFHVLLSEPPLTALRTSGANNAAVAPPPQVVANDKFTARIRFYERNASGQVALSKFESSFVISMQAVSRTPVSASPLWIVSDGVLVESESDAYYELLVNTATNEMAAMLTTTERKELLVNIQVADGSVIRTVAYFSITALKDLLVSSELSATPTPSYLLQSMKATQAEAEAGTADDKWMTPLKTAQAIAAAAGQNSVFENGILVGTAPNQFRISVDSEGVLSTEPV